MSSHSLPREVEAVVLALCDDSASAMGKVLRELIARRDWDSISSLEINPSTYSDSESYFIDAQLISFLRKYEPLNTSIDRKAVAVDSFHKAERKCFRTNQRLLPFVYGTYGADDEAVFQFITEVRKEVVGLIGPRPPANPAGKFGPGATFGDRSGLTTIPDKMQSTPDITSDAYAFLVPWSGTMWAKACAERGDRISFNRGNRFTTVPKDCRKDRGISIEPSINLFYQLAFGSAIRERLKGNTSNRLVLGEMQNIHKQVACEASISGRFATLDLSQASDTVSSSLVKLLLPRLWHEPLDDLRSKHTSIPGVDGLDRWYKLEKFSSMGNGYTFELETLLFLAICSTVLRLKGITPRPGINVFVYGDDIIVPTDCAADVTSALQFFGMDLNKTKSFVDGPFRESCGGDYFRGVDVRPYFLKESPCEPQHFIAMANGIRGLVRPDNPHDLRWHFVRRAWFRCLDFIPSNIKQCRGPVELGDICIHDEPQYWGYKWSHDFRTSDKRYGSSIRYIRVYRPASYRTVAWKVFDPDVQLAGALYGLPWDNGLVKGRDCVSGHAIGWVPFS